MLQQLIFPSNQKAQGNKIQYNLSLKLDKCLSWEKNVYFEISLEIQNLLGRGKGKKNTKYTSNFLLHMLLTPSFAPSSREEKALSHPQ